MGSKDEQAAGWGGLFAEAQQVVVVCLKGL